MGPGVKYKDEQDIPNPGAKKEKVAILRIPNLDAKKEFIEAALRIFDIDHSLLAHIKAGINFMKEKEDVSELCYAFELGSQTDRGVRDIIQGEASFAEVVFNRLLVCRHPLDKVKTEYSVDKEVRESNNQTRKKSIDIVYTDFYQKRRFCFELKNLRIQDLMIGVPYAIPKQENYDKLKELSDEVASMNLDQVLNLQLRPKEYYEQQKATWILPNFAPTVYAFMENVKKEVSSKYKGLLQQDDKTDGRALAWVLLRVGLGKVVASRVF
jgi:hypothetical protein